MIDQTFKLLAKLAKHIANRSRDFSHMVKNPADRKRSWYKFVSCILLTLCITYIILGQEHIGSSGIALGITSSAAQAEHVEALLFFVAHNIINMCAKGEIFYPYLNGECDTVAELAKARPLTLEIVNQITAPICATQAGDCNLQDWLDRHNQNQPSQGVSDNAGRFFTALAALLVATGMIVMKWVKAEDAASPQADGRSSNVVTPVDLDVLEKGAHEDADDEGYPESPPTTSEELNPDIQKFGVELSEELQMSPPGSPGRPKALK